MAKHSQKEFADSDSLPFSVWPGQVEDEDEEEDTRWFRNATF